MQFFTRPASFIFYHLMTQRKKPIGTSREPNPGEQAQKALAACITLWSLFISYMKIDGVTELKASIIL